MSRFRDTRLVSDNELIGGNSFRQADMTPEGQQNSLIILYWLSKIQEEHG